MIHRRKCSNLVRYRYVSVDIRNLQILGTEMFKVHKDLSPPIFKELFNKRTLTYELRHSSQFTIPRVESVYKGPFIACLGHNIWNMVPSELNNPSRSSFCRS